MKRYIGVKKANENRRKLQRTIKAKKMLAKTPKRKNDQLKKALVALIAIILSVFLGCLIPHNTQNEETEYPEISLQEDSQESEIIRRTCGGPLIEEELEATREYIANIEKEVIDKLKQNNTYNLSLTKD